MKISFKASIVILLYLLTIVNYANAQAHQLKFNKLDAKAVLIGEQINLLSDNLESIKDISEYSEKIIQVLAVSDSLFVDQDDFCNSYWLVKIKIGEFTGIVNGRQVFKLLEGKTYWPNDKKIEIFKTQFFGMGIDYDGELLGCPVDQPIILKDDERNYFGLVNLMPNELSGKARWDNTYQFFELRNDDGYNDEITSIEVKQSSYILKIHRNFMEGENDFKVKLQYEYKMYSAEFVHFGEIEY
jgi:hypothetical protein